MMMMRRAAQRAANVAVRAHPERSAVAAAARFQQQQCAGFATIYDVTPTPYEVSFSCIPQGARSLFCKAGP